ncbi:MAG: serine/threonine protein kinase [Pyrinomonadaceae bacterium]|nr:serine/threonine protein kinase [Pyrinomonadaceae bacterium]
MNNADWETVKEVFGLVIDEPVETRDKLLRQRCGDDEALYAEVHSLIVASTESDNIIESNAIDLAAKIDLPKVDYADRHFGNYRIIREIGSGGMGSVFLAERDDGEFSMQVALKIVRQSIADSEVISRFKQERQILASLHHPNIAVLHDGGLSDKGEPFLAMEYIEGQTLIDYCHDKALSINDRLFLFLKICSAVAYAHRNLVVHRDIKPTNILVTADGEPKLLDFGLAKAFESNSTQTLTAYRAFTPAYASPEQILGKPVSTASDQYSLGVVLFELLTGTKPFDFDGMAVDQMILSLQANEVRSPSTAIHTHNISETRGVPFVPLSRDLDNITLKALRKEPERRYGSVEGLADDIQRYLDGRAVTARPSTFSYLTSRFVRRHKAGVAAASLVVIAFIAALVVSLWQTSIARSERDRAESRFQEVRQLSNSLLFEIAPKIERLPGSTDARELLVLRALEYLDDLAAESRSDETLQAELAMAYQKVGDLQGNPAKPNLSDFAGAIESYEKAGAILANLPQTVETRTKKASVLKELAKIRFAQSEIEASIRDSHSAVAAFKELAAEMPNSPEIGRSLAATEIELAHTFAINNQYDVAIPLYRQTLDRLSSMDRNDRETRRLLTIGTAYLSNGLSWNSQQSEAEAENQTAVALAEALRAGYPNDSEVQRTVLNVFTLASGTFETIKNDVSLSFAEKALEVARRSAEADPADTQARQNLAKAISRYGIVLTLVDRTADGFKHLHQAETILVGLIEREPRNKVYQDDLGTLYTRFGDAELQRKDLVSALEAYKRSAAIFAKLAESDEKNLVAKRDWAQAIKSVGTTQVKLGQNEAAKESLLHAMEIVGKLREQNALGKWDDKLFEEMQPLLAKLNS